MTKLKIADNKEYFLDENGDKFFYLADTAWSAFTNANIEDWEEYLDHRAQQGFNVLQINILRQWDASGSNLEREPFEVKSDGTYDFYNYDEKYFNNAKKMLDMARNKGFIPALVVLWCDYVPDTWADKRKVIDNQVMPKDAVAPYVSFAVEQFKEFNPIYLVSGDTDFPSKKANEYYMEAFKVIKEKTPEAITTLHLGSKPQDVHQDFVESDYLDFYMYQSGHGFQHIDFEGSLSYGLAEKFLNKPIKRPILNGEPCYEGMGIDGKSGRFNEYDVRKTVWQSILSGGKAGVTYGAHGVWSWHKKGQSFAAKDHWGEPFNIKEAFRLEGSWDAAFAKNIFEKYDLFELSPANELLKNKDSEIRISANKTKFAMYLPYSVNVILNKNLNNFNLTVIDLKTQKYIELDVICGAEKSIIEMYQANNDILIIGEEN
jgi:hypothetical protein